MAFVPKQLAVIAEEVKTASSTPTATVRALLDWFGAKRRGYFIISAIRETLSELEIQTVPDFEAAYIDAEVEFRKAESVIDGKPTEAEPAIIVAPPSAAQETPIVEIPAQTDPTQRIGKLAAANTIPASVTPDSTVLAAVSIMMAEDYSQLPVMIGERDVKGVVSWRSIGKRFSLGRPHNVVREVMDPVVVLDSDTSLFAAISTIVDHDFVLVRHADKKIGGIVTTSDLSNQFGQLGEPFLLLGEIENHIRRLLNGKFTDAELKSASDPADSREIKAVSDMTFGGYVRLLENPARWNALQLGIDRSVFVQRLNRIRDIRNDVMHFDPDGISPEDLSELRLFAALLRDLYKLGAI